MAMKRINCYGEVTEDVRYDFREHREPSDTKFAGGATYDRYGPGDPCAIHRLRLGADGLVEELWAYGAWADAEKLAYERTIDETMEVDG